MPSNKLNMSLWHDGKVWKAQNEEFSVSSRELQGLDENLLDQLRSRDRFPKGSEVEVFMSFDQSVIPEWIRQYANHYFNRSLTLKI